MFSLMQQWLNRTFGHVEVLVLIGLTALAILIIENLGDVFAPVFVSLVFAYLLQAPINRLKRLRVPQLPAMLLVFSIFMAFLAIMIVLLLPLLVQQLVSFYHELPTIFYKVKLLQEKIPPLLEEFIQTSEWQRAIQDFTETFQSYSQSLLRYSFANLPNLMMVCVYIVLSPLLIFFFLKDQTKILAWFGSYLPQSRPMLQQIWRESNRQIGNYVRGKFWEAGIVGFVTFVAFVFFHLKYATLLAFLVGISVFIPYIGAAVVTVPVALVSFFQWGFSAETIYLLSIYGIIQTLDGTLLVPLLFSEAVSMHPIVIIIATLFFGAVWGLGGMFFAIPLAAFLQAILQAWPKSGNL